MIILSSGQEVSSHDLLGVVGWDLPQSGVRLVAPARELEVQVPPTAVHLQHLDGAGVGVVNLYHGGVAGIQGKLHTRQGFNSVRVGSARTLDIVPKTARTGVDIQGVLHHPCLSPEKYNVKSCITSWRYHLE